MGKRTNAQSISQERPVPPLGGENWLEGRIVNVIEEGEYGGASRSAHKRHMRETSHKINGVHASTVRVENESIERISPLDEIQQISWGSGGEMKQLRVGKNLPPEELTEML
ncbi:hypothetical protein Salat_0695400 [Sesamum alatum]|uniref:Uncharacterized protein n=1 Tax=Sesamum alatum TaxID=300844 RepID=A0AAE2CUU3_9LAMI|nr:hypothetical protein Salat_0695400 [Sesamum alatum]